MGVRGPAPSKFLRLNLSQRWKTAFYVEVKGTITFFKSPFHEITTKFLADHAARRSIRSRIHEPKNNKITKSRAEISQITLHVKMWRGPPKIEAYYLIHVNFPDNS